MSNAPQWVIEKGNIWVDNVDGSPGLSNHLNVKSVKLPAIEEQYVEHNAGGSTLGIEINTYLNRLEAPFVLLGMAPQVMSLIGLSRQTNLHFHIRGAMRDRQSGTLFQCTAELWGRLGRVNTTEYAANNVPNNEYSIRGIVHYELWLGTQEVYYFDFFNQLLRVGGVDQMTSLLAVLGVTGGGSVTGVTTAPTQPLQPAT